MPLSQAGQDPVRAPVHILAVPRTGYVLAVFAGPLRGVIMHWTRGGSVPCLPEPDCPAAIHRSGSTWKGYAPVRMWDHSLGVWMPFVLEVTEALEEVLRGRDLRGEVWRLSRCRKKKGSGAVQGVLEELRTDVQLLTPFDVRVVVQRRFHCGPLVWDVPNPIVPKLKVEAASAPPPSCLPIIDPYQPSQPAIPLDAADRGLGIADRIKRIAQQQKAEGKPNGQAADH